MTDASPLHRYIVLDRPSDFCAFEKVRYAMTGDETEHNSPTSMSSSKPASPLLRMPRKSPNVLQANTLEHDLKRRKLIRTVDELKRIFTPHGGPSSPVTGSSGVSPEGFPSGVGGVSAMMMNEADEMMDRGEEVEDLDTCPWESGGAQVSFWSWPVEVLYQAYHIVVALDLGQSSYDVSRNGVVLADRIPSVMQALLQVLSTTLTARERDVQQISAWVEANIADEHLRESILRNVWSPTVEVSVILVNTPKPSDVPVRFDCPRDPLQTSESTGIFSERPTTTTASSSSAAVHGRTRSRGGATNQEEEEEEEPALQEATLLPPHLPRYTPFVEDTNHDRCLTSIPILSRCNARRLLSDPHFIDRLTATLTRYEHYCRTHLMGGTCKSWPNISLSSTIETTTRNTPNSSRECYSLIIVSHVHTVSCPHTLTLMENAMRRKNIILSVVALNRLVSFDAPELSPLAQFLASAGGLAVNVDYWLSLASPKLNREWCRRFEGSRCLAQQIFVQLVNRFPVAIPGISNAVSLALEDSTPLSNMELPVFLLSCPTLAMLQAIAAARFNQGWSVLMDYANEHTAAHLVARYYHRFHRGTLLLQYELHITRPAAYRVLVVSGARTLVEHFSRIRYCEHTGMVQKEPTGSWLAYLTMLRIQLHYWMKAEQTMINVLNSAGNGQLVRGLTWSEINAVSSVDGVMSEWLDHSFMFSFGLFFGFDQLPPAVLLALTKSYTNANTANNTNANNNNNAMPAASAAGVAASSPAATANTISAIRAGKLVVYEVMNALRYWIVGKLDDLTFIRKTTDGFGACVLQFFAVEAEAGGCILAGAMECRLAFFNCCANDRLATVRELIAGIEDYVREMRCDPPIQAPTTTHTATSSSLADEGERPSASPSSSSSSPAPASLFIRAGLKPPPSCAAMCSASFWERRLHVRVAFNFANHQALLLALCTLTPRRPEMVSDYLNRYLSPARVPPHGLPPDGSNAFIYANAARGGLNNSGVVGGGGVGLGGSAGLSSVPPASLLIRGGASPPSMWQALRRAMRVPFIIPHWYLTTAMRFVWMLHPAEIEYSAGYADDIFAYALLRRLRSGFVILACNNASRQAVLHAERRDAGEAGADGADATVHIFDVVEAVENPSNGEVYLRITRLISPYRHACRHVGRFTRDVQIDLHLGTALHTYRVLSLGPARDTAAPLYTRRLGPQQLAQRGMTVLYSRVESLLGYLRTEAPYTEWMELPTPPSLGREGAQRLRSSLVHLLNAIGHRCTRVAASTLHPNVAQCVAWGKAHGDADATSSSSSTNVQQRRLPPNAAVVVATIYPIRFKTITFVMMLEEDPDGAATTADGSRSIHIGLGFMNSALLHDGLVQQYKPPPPTSTEACSSSSTSPPECPPDAAIVQSVRRLLHTYTSIHNTKQLMLALQSPSARRSAVMEELESAAAELSVYSIAIDASHLLRVVQARHARRGATRAEQMAALQRVLAQLMAHHFINADSHPSLFIPSGRGELEVVEHEEQPQHHLPFLVKVGLVVRSSSATTTASPSSSSSSSADDECVEDAAWLSRFEAANTPEEGGDVCHSPWQLGDDDNDDDDGEEGRDAPIIHYEGRHTVHRKPSTATQPPSHASPFRAHPTLQLNIFIKTVPHHLYALCNDADFHPTPAAVHGVMRTLIYQYGAAGTSSGEVAAGAVVEDKLRHFFDAHDDDSGGGGGDGAKMASAMREAQRMSGDLSGVPETVEVAVSGVAEALRLRIAQYCLHACFDTTAYHKVAQLLAQGSTNPSSSSTATTSNADGGGTVEMANRPSAPSLSLGSEDLLQRIHRVAGLRAVVDDVVAPALLSVSAFEGLMVPVKFTQQLTNARMVEPVEAALAVFQRCVREDLLCFIPTTHFSYVFFPAAASCHCPIPRRWMMVHMEMLPGSAMSKASILSYDDAANQPYNEGCGGVASADGMEIAHHLRTHLYRKILQISQLHLLSQLRDTQNASPELIPVDWGDQFRGSNNNNNGGGAGAGAGHINMHGHGGGRGGISTSEIGSTSGSSDGSSTSVFHLPGRTVLEIPLYYKLQHQCRKILSRIVGNSSRLELISIFNREQCFVVADEVEADLFHYLRLVFVKDVAEMVPTTAPSPAVLHADRCPRLVVQLFSATVHAVITRPLQKLQDFCYFLAVQELQSHFNYVEHRIISFNDLVFLQNQRLEPLRLDVASVVQPISAAQRLAPLAMSMLFVKLRENKYRLFQAQVDSEDSHSASNFVEHYNLEAGVRQEHTSNMKSPNQHNNTQTATQVPPKPSTSSTPSATTRAGAAPQLLRFVRMVDGLTDVLVSCALHVDPQNPSTIIIARYHTKTPTERYTGQMESVFLQEISDYVQDAIAQVAFLHVCEGVGPLQVPSLRHSVDAMMQLSRGVKATEASMLLHRSFSLEEVGTTLLASLVEDICGVLNSMHPRCFESRTSSSSSSSSSSAEMAGFGAFQTVESFSWQWVEQLQNDLHADEAEFIITCGFSIRDLMMMRDDVEAPTTASIPAEMRLHDVSAVRVVPCNMAAAVPLTQQTSHESQRAVLQASGLYVPCPVGSRLIIRLSLTDGLEVCVFNMQDCDFVLRLLGQTLDALERESALLQHVLMQRLGYAIGCPFSEGDLAKVCCGDARNIIANKALIFHGDAYRRGVHHVRFQSRPPAERPRIDALVIALEGLFNRGLIINHTFCLEDAIRVLYYECPSLELMECVRILCEYLHNGVLVEVKMSGGMRPRHRFLDLLRSSRLPAAGFTCRLANCNGVPSDALVACDFHRHVQAAHIIVEAQNARSDVAQLLALCDAQWRAEPQKHDPLELAKTIVELQMKSKEVLGLRVPDFLLRQERWCLEDDQLDPTLPVLRIPSESSGYCNLVNARLQRYTNHLRAVYPSMVVIDLNPTNTSNTNFDPVLLNRLRCRYAKYSNDDGQHITFTPHLFYAIISIMDLLRGGVLKGNYESLLPYMDEEHPMASSGCCVVEVGMQVLHYALDFFVVKGDERRVPPGVMAAVAAEFSSSLLFDAILYDASVEDLVHALKGRHPTCGGAVGATTSATGEVVEGRPSTPIPLERRDASRSSPGIIQPHRCKAATSLPAFPSPTNESCV